MGSLETHSYPIYAGEVVQNEGRSQEAKIEADLRMREKGQGALRAGAASTEDVSSPVFECRVFSSPHLSATCLA